MARGGDRKGRHTNTRVSKEANAQHVGKRPYRLVVRTSRCGRDNPGSTPGEDIFVDGERATLQEASILSTRKHRGPASGGVWLDKSLPAGGGQTAEELQHMVWRFDMAAEAAGCQAPVV